jgi:hypothetical protein
MPIASCKKDERKKDTIKYEKVKIILSQDPMLPK